MKNLNTPIFYISIAILLQFLLSCSHVRKNKLLKEFPKANTAFVSPLKPPNEIIQQTYESPHPYTAVENGNIAWTQSIKYTDTAITFIAVHFQKLELSSGDQLIIRSPNNSRRYEYDRETLNRNPWSGRIFENELVIEIVSKNKQGNYGYLIDKIAVGILDNTLSSSLDNDATKIQLTDHKTTLEGTWQVISIGDRKLHEIESRTSVLIFARDTESKYSIGVTIGCNNIVKSAQIEKNTIKFGSCSTTQKGCGYMTELEEKMNTNLSKVSEFKFVNDLLKLTDASGENVFVLKPFKPDVVGTWQIYSIGKRQLSAKENGTIIIRKDENSTHKLEVSVGCNNISSKAQFQYETILLSDIESTEKVCGQLTELEDEIKSMLKNVDTYKLQGDTMVFFRKGHYGLILKRKR